MSSTLLPIKIKLLRRWSWNKGCHDACTNSKIRIQNYLFCTACTRTTLFSDMYVTWKQNMLLAIFNFVFWSNWSAWSPIKPVPLYRPLLGIPFLKKDRFLQWSRTLLCGSWTSEKELSPNRVQFNQTRSWGHLCCHYSPTLAACWSVLGPRSIHQSRIETNKVLILIQSYCACWSLDRKVITIVTIMRQNSVYCIKAISTFFVRLVRVGLLPSLGQSCSLSNQDA